MLYELGSRQGMLSRNDRARLRWRAAEILLMENPGMTYEQAARDVGYARHCSLSYGLKRLRDDRWVKRFVEQRRAA